MSIPANSARLFVTLVSLACCKLSLAEAATPDFAAALLGGKPKLNLRVRLEHVRDDSFGQSASAPTYRFRLTYETLAWHHASVLVEGDYLGLWGGDAYNSTRNGRAARPQIPDPEAADLNQAAIKFSGKNDDAVLGRQRIVLDNQRFVGGVAWRQNEQTFDAALLRTRRLPRTVLTYVFADNVNRVFGPERGVPAPDLRVRAQLLHASIDLRKAGTLSAFAHWIDVRTTPALGHQNLGLLWTGTRTLSPGWTLPWSLSVVRQQDYGRNPTSYSADYYQGELAISHRDVTLRAGYESLGGDATRGEHRFQTPLATLHVFQGWADKFLTTPPQGIRDLYLQATAKRWGSEAQVAWHDFRAEASSQHYGHEWDMSVSRKMSPHLSLLVKAADYRSAGFGRDTRKVWLQAVVDYP